MQEHDRSRREFVKKAAYMAPAVLSLQAYSSLARAGSTKGDDVVSPSKPAKKPKKRKKR